MEKKHIWLLVGYLIGSFFGVSQLLALFGGMTGAKAK